MDSSLHVFVRADKNLTRNFYRGLATRLNHFRTGRASY